MLALGKCTVVKIELSCAQCGGNRFDYPLVLKDDSLITCSDCDHEIGTVAQLQTKLLAALNRGKSRQNEVRRKAADEGTEGPQGGFGPATGQ